MFVRIRLPLALLGSLFWLTAVAAEQSAVRIEMGGVKQRRYDESGKPVAVIWAELATVNDEGILFMEGVKATVFTDDGREIEIRASKAQADTEGTGDAVFEGDIEVSLSDFVAKTSRAVWRESDRTVRGDDKIVLEGRGSTVVGSGFVVHTPEGKRVVYRPRGIIPLDKGEDNSEAKKAGDTPRSRLEK
jgi:LPS export ABC transporter protein LptC